MTLDKKSKVIEYSVIVLLSLLTTIVLAQISHYGITGIELLLPCVFALCMITMCKTYGLWKFEKERIKEIIKYAVPTGIIVDIASVVGSKINLDTRVFEKMGILDGAYVILMVPFWTCVFVLLFFSSDAISKRLGEKGVTNILMAGDYCQKQTTKKKIFKDMVIMLVCWLPYYLTYYPGGIGNDIFESVNMCLGTIPLTNHHPVFFTAIIKLFISIFGANGNLSLALGMMTMCQMLILALTLSMILAWIDRQGIARSVRTVTVLFFAFHPVMAMYSIYLTKDVLFSCIVVVLVLYISDYLKAANSNKIQIKHHVILGILCLLTMITRNNGTLVVIISMLALAAGIKKTRKSVILVFIAGLLVNAIYKGPVWNAMGVKKQSFAESAAIPLTQIAYTIYTDGAFNEEDERYLQELMPFDVVKMNFEPGYVDTYKFDSEFNADVLDANPSKFMNVWFGNLGKNFGRYVEGYLFETCGYWSYGVTNTVATEGVKENKLGIEGINIIESMTGISLQSLLAELVLVARKLPLLCGLTQMAVEILAVWLLTCQYLRRSKKDKVYILVPLFAVWISVMIASPAYCLFRYMFPLFMLWPVILTEFYYNRE